MGSLECDEKDLKNKNSSNIFLTNSLESSEKQNSNFIFTTYEHSSEVFDSNADIFAKCKNLREARAEFFKERALFLKTFSLNKKLSAPNIRGGDAPCEILFLEEVLFSDQHLQSVCKDENFDISDERPFHVKYDIRSDPSLLSIKIELENIANALHALRSGLEDLPSLSDHTLTHRYSRDWLLSNKQLLQKRDHLITEYNSLIDSLQRELKRLKRRFERKKQRHVRMKIRGKRRETNSHNTTTEEVKSVEQRYKPDVSEAPSCRKPNVQISSIEIIEAIIDTGNYTNHMNADLVLEEIFKKLAIDESTPISNEYREEIVNLVKAASSQIDEITPEIADWLNDVKRRDVLLYHSLLADEVIRLNEVLERYSSSVLLGPRDELKMGKATQRRTREVPH